MKALLATLLALVVLAGLCWSATPKKQEPGWADEGLREERR